MKRDNETIIWEVKLNATQHSTYYDEILRNLDGPENIIKPDIIVLFKSQGKNKALIGDVKFLMTDNGLPRLESVYKILSYVID